MKLKTILYSMSIFALLFLSACGNEEQAAVKKDQSETEATEDKKDGKVAEEKTESAKVSGEVLNPYIAEESQGEVEVIYTNSQPGYTHDMNGFKVTVEEYQIVSVKDIHQDYVSSFDGQTEGYVVTAKATIDNQTDKAMYYPPNFRIQVTNEYDYIPSDTRTFIKEEEKLKSKKETETSKFAAGEKVTGLVTFKLTNDEYQSLSTVPPKFVIEGGAADNNQFSGSFKGNAIFDFIINDGQKEELASQPAFYQDQLITNNMAEKKMIFEKTGINQTETLNDVKVTLDGIQYTDVTPTESYKETFRNFGDSGMVAITVKFILDNQSQQSISSSWTSGKIIVDENRGSLLSQGQLEPSGEDEIKAGEKGEKLAVFLLRKDEFEIFKKFDLEFGPLRNPNNEDISKGHTVKFELPTK